MTFSNTETNNELGLALKQPSSQTIIPVVTDNGNIMGFFTIAKTTFDGTETTFDLSEGPIDITSITLPAKVDDGSGYGVEQYMAAYYDVPRLREWLGYSAFVSVNDTGYATSYSMPVQGYVRRHNRGILITNLSVTMDTQGSVLEVNVPPNVQNAAVRWVAKLSANSVSLKCGFFDFPWTTLFKAKSDLTPLRIEIVANPVGGVFKSTLVPNPVISPLGNVEFNTVRIIKLGDAVPGDYVFNYLVVDDKNQSTPCTLTLSVV